MSSLVIEILSFWSFWNAFSFSYGVPLYEPVGCFLDSGISPHPMPVLLKNFRPEMKWDDITAVIDWCARLAHDRSLSYFGLQNYGECWSGETAGQTYSRDGRAENCKSGVGLSQSTYFVYKFFDYGDKVPGCKEKWKAHNNFCFSVLTNDTLSTNEMKDFCLENKGELVYAMNKSSFHLAEQFLYTMQLNAETNSSRRVVLGPANASSFATLPVSNSSVSGSVATHTCAYSDSSQLKVEPCNANNCDYLCMGLREADPVIGKLAQLVTDAAISGHVIKRVLVDDVITCARECLLYLNCLSVNYEYKQTGDRDFPILGRICELNDETKKDVHLRRRDGYKYYERFNI